MATRLPADIRPAKSGRLGGRGAPSNASSTFRGAHTSPLPLPLPEPTGDRGESVVALMTVARDESPENKLKIYGKLMMI